VLGFLLVVLPCAGCGSAPPPRPHAPSEPEFETRYVLVNWLGQGRLYVAKAIAEDSSLVRVRYADGTEEWAEAARIDEERIAAGDHVTVLLRDSLPAWGGTVRQRRADRVLVLFDAGGTAWVDLSRIEAVGPTPDTLRLPDARRIVEENEPTPAEEMPPIDPARLVAGATLTAVWVGRPFDAIVIERRGELLQVRWDGDGTLGWIALEWVREVFPPADPAAAVPGARVRARSADGHAYDAVVLARRAAPGGAAAARRARIRVRWVKDGTEADLTAADVLRIHPRAPVDDIREGAHARVGWLGDVFEAEVLERRGDLIHIRWTVDGGDAWVEAADVREIRREGGSR
jgi:hypothetical protein